MQRQTVRDHKTLDIAGALLVFVVVVGAGALALWLTDLAVGLTDDVAASVFPALYAVAAICAVGHLVRRRAGRRR